jgi:hypothetical protein
MTVANAKVEITPSLMAESFWLMDSEQQIKFFSELARVIKEDYKTNTQAYSLGELQWCYMAEDMKKKENQEAKQMLMTMASFLYWHTLNYKDTL